MLLRQIFDPYLAQYSYLIGCQKTGEALIIDPERDIDRYQTLARENGLRITAVTETHIHADFVSGAQEFSRLPGVSLYLSDEGGPEWTYAWSKGLPNMTLLKDGSVFTVGNIRIEAVHTPGHTPEHLSFLITDSGGGATEPIALATGDFLFVGDVGRPDLLESAAGIKNMMEPSARALSDSLRQRLAPYGDYLQILPAHGAGSACGKSLGAVPISTLGYERRFNAPFKLAMSNDDAFVKDILHGQPEPPPYFATMKRVNRDGIKITGGVPVVPHLSVEQLSHVITESQTKILDTRDNKEHFGLRHTKQAIWAPLHSPFFSVVAGSYLEENDKIVLIVERDSDVDNALRQLYRIGLDSILGWTTTAETQSANLPFEANEMIPFSSFNSAEARKEGLIVDVRLKAEHDAGHISGALSIPYTRLKTRLAELPQGKKVFVHCASGKRAALATSFLRSIGYTAVHIDGDFATCPAENPKNVA